MKFKIFLIILGLLLLTGWFYWFQWRPSAIHSKCDSDAIWNTRRVFGWMEFKTQGGYMAKSYNFYYDRCLNMEGLR